MLILKELGPKVNLLYLPSQVATVSLQLAMKQLLMKDFDYSAVLEESARIQGYDADGWEANGVSKLLAEVEALDLVRQYQGVELPEMVRLSLFPQRTSDSAINMITPIKLGKNLSTPQKMRSKMDSDSPLKLVKGQSGASPLKRPGR